MKCPYPFRFVIPVLLIFGLAVTSCAAVTHPVAALKPANGSLFVLTSDGTVLAMNLSLSSGSVVGKFNTRTAGILSDLAYGVVDGRPSLFVASSNSNGHAIVGMIQAFTTNGQLLNTWLTGHIVNGVAFDSSSQLVYFSSGDSPEIYSINPKQKSSVSYVAEIAGASKLGSLAIDPAAHKLYISDISQGTLYAMTVGDKHIRSIGQVGTPQAVLLDDNASTLVVADSSRRQIVSFALGSTVAKPVSITARGSFRNPSGVAWSDPTHLIVADQDAGTISLVTLATGQTLYSVSLP